MKDQPKEPFWGQFKNNHFFNMSWIEVKALRTLMKILETKPDINSTIQIFNRQYFFRTTLKAVDVGHLPIIAQKINQRHKKNGIQTPTKFGNSQLKLFGWVVILICHQQQLFLQQMTQEQYLKIQSIFKYVEIPRIVYQIKCFCHTKGQIQTSWSRDQISMFQNLVKEKKATQWKNIAFEMFKRSDCKYFRFFEQYREKWINYLNPQLKKGKWTLDDSIKMVTMVVSVGRKWAFISREFNCMRSEHSVKNHFKKLLREILKMKDEGAEENHIEIDRELLSELMKRKVLKMEVSGEEEEEEGVKAESRRSGEMQGEEGQRASWQKRSTQGVKREERAEGEYIFYPPIQFRYPQPKTEHSPFPMVAKEQYSQMYDYRFISR